MEYRPRAWLRAIAPAANWLKILADSIVWVLAALLAALARFDFDVGTVDWVAVATLGLALAGVHLLIAGFLLLYRGRYQTGSFEESRAVAMAATVAALIVEIAVIAIRPAGIARSIPFLAWPLAVLGLEAVRFAKRLVIEANSRPNGDAERVLIYGAGSIGSALALSMLRDPDSPYLPVGFLDDDESKSRMQLHGIPVVGRGADLVSSAERLQAKAVVVAIKEGDAALVPRITDGAGRAHIDCLILPPLKQLLKTNHVELSSLRAVDMNDFVGRRVIDTDTASIADYLAGRRVLVTGASGSIGSELCRELLEFSPASVIMLDRDESALAAAELSILRAAPRSSVQIALVDLRDATAVRASFLRHRPDVVFHAGALKHVPLLERFPEEALQSNVYGTLNVLDAALQADVTHLVNVSTIKAADPTGALAQSKHLAERITAWYAHQHHRRYVSVRFGNVLGSRGSVLHTFAAQIDNGGTVTVSDPEISRYFMTLSEACQLMIQAGAIGRPGDVLVLDMGEPVRILDIAQRMIARSGKPVEIVFSGLREGESLSEPLFGVDEIAERPIHPLIAHIQPPPLARTHLASEPWVRGVVGSRPREPEPRYAS